MLLSITSEFVPIQSGFSSYIHLTVWFGLHTVENVSELMIHNRPFLWDADDHIIQKTILMTMLFAFPHSASVVPGFYLPRFSLDDKIMGQFSTSEHDFHAQLSCLRSLQIRHTGRATKDPLQFLTQNCFKMTQNKIVNPKNSVIIYYESHGI